MDFLNKLIEKVLDFFNMGRVISIFIPGVVVTIAFLMLLSLLITPKPECRSDVSTTKGLPVSSHDATTPNYVGSAIQSQVSSAACKACMEAIAHPPTKPSTAQKNPTVSKDAQACLAVQQQLSSPACKKCLASLNATPPQAALEQQIIKDFKLAVKYPWIICLLSLIFGILIYEFGNAQIGKMKCADDNQLHGYKYPPSPPDPLKVTADTAAAAAGSAALPDKLITDDNKPVGLIYFAPYLKDTFITGGVNYFSFLIIEYYRFLEFSVVIPLAILITNFLALFYYLIAARMLCCLFFPETTIVIMAAVIITGLYFWFRMNVLPLIYANYRKNAFDLIKGITDAKNLNQFKP